MKSATRLFGLAAVACLALTACDDADVTGIDEDSNFQIVLKPEDGSASTTAVRSAAAVSDPLRAIVDLDNVASITLPIGRVEAHQEGGAWVDAGSVNQDIDLLALPSGGIELVESELPEGEYDALRFFLTGDATITLVEATTVGRTTFSAGTHELRIPSVDQSGLKLNADFTVDADGEILTVLFDGQATVRRVTATGSGVLMMNPVLRVTDEAGDDVGETDDEDDEDFEAEFEGVVETVGTSSFTLTNGAVVEVHAGTVFEGDILTLEAVTEAVAAGEVVEAEGEGDFAADGTTILAAKVKFETDGDDGDDEEETEVEGAVTNVNRVDLSFTVDDDGTAVTVLMATNTEVEGDFETFDEMADAFEAGAEIEAEAEGVLDEAGALVASEVDFDVEEADEEEFEGVVTAVSSAASTVTVLLDSGATLVVAVTSSTVIDAGGDLTTFGDVVAAFNAGATIEVEGEGVLDAGTGVLAATEIKFETD